MDTLFHGFRHVEHIGALAVGLPIIWEKKQRLKAIMNATKKNVVKCVCLGTVFPWAVFSVSGFAKWLTKSHCERAALEVPINLPGTRVQRIGLFEALKLRV